MDKNPTNGTHRADDDWTRQFPKELTAEQAAERHTPEDLALSMGRLDEEIGEIEAQLARARTDWRTHRIPADTTWRRSAEVALKHRRVLRQTLQNAFGIVNRRRHQQEVRANIQANQQQMLSFARLFQQVARRELPFEQYVDLMEKTKEEAQRRGVEPDGVGRHEET